MTVKHPHLQLKGLLADSNGRKPSLLPLQKPSPLPRTAGSFSLPYKRTVFFFIAISSALLLLNTANIHFSAVSTAEESLSNSTFPKNSPQSSTGSRHGYDYEHGTSVNRPKQSEYSPIYNDEDDDDIDEDEGWRFTDEHGLNDNENEGEDEEEHDVNNLPSKPQRGRPARIVPFKSIEGILPPNCPNLVLTTETSFESPSYVSSSTVPPPSTSATSPSSSLLTPDQVHCQRIPSQLKNYSLAFCISNSDCSRGFIQIVHKLSAPVAKFKTSKDTSHDLHFRQVAGPDDFYFLLEGAQKLALGAHLVPNNLEVNVDNSSHSGDSNSSSLSDAAPSDKLVYRADFRMALPGPIQLFGWLTYENFRAVRENRPGVWPQWTHSILIDPKTVVNPTENATTKFTICPDCELSSFLDQVKTYREQHFEQCDRMVPVRGSYWREDLAVKVYSGLDIVNNAPGAGAFYKAPNSNNVPKPQNGKLTRGWRFVPNGCTMTKTSSQLHGSSQNPYVPTCDSIASPTAAMRPPKPAEQDHDTNNSDNNDSNNENNYPRRRILFTGDSQVRTTYNSILSHYRPVDPHQRFPAHSEFLPVLENLNLNNTQTEKPNSAITTPRTESDTEIELVYRADQFLDYLLDSSDEELDKYDTIYLNIGQWPASGPVAGGQWSTAKLLERWEGVIQRLNRWKESREARLVARRQQRYERGSDPDMNMDPKEDPTVGSGESSIVIWAGMNAFPMRTDTSIRVKGDWRTNARLGYWDDWIEIISQEAGGWFRRLNSWQLTFPMLDQVTDKAHFQETDAIDALKLEALYKLDLCSRMSADTPYSDLLSESVTIATSNTTA